MDKNKITFNIDFDNYTREQLEQLKDKLSKYLLQNARNDAINTLRGHKYLENKYYKMLMSLEHKNINHKYKFIYKYVKIINVRSINVYKVSALTFPEKPLYSFEPNMFRYASCDDELTGLFDLYSFKIENLMIDDKILNNFNCKEISEQEWEEAFDKHCELLKNMTFIADYKEGEALEDKLFSKEEDEGIFWKEDYGTTS